MKRTLYSIQFLRTVAIVIVVIYHAYIYSYQYNKELYIKIPHEFGILGVMLFFTLSGFIMSFLLDKKEEFFILRRIARIYPIYIFIVIGVVFTKVLIFGSIEQQSLLYSITLLPWGNINSLSYPLGIEWSLVYEIFFYFICSLMTLRIFSSYKRIIFILIWAIVIIYFNFSFYEVSPMRPRYSEIFLSIFNLSFIVGFLSYFIFQKITIKSKIKFSYLMVFVLFIMISELFLFRNFHNGLIKILIISLLNSILLIMLLSSDESFKEKKLLLRIGDNSYGIYLIHVVFITVTLSILSKFSININTYLMIIIFLLSLIIGYLVGEIDNFFHSFFKNKIDTLVKRK